MNSVSERRNHTMLDILQSMTSFLNLSISLWGYVLEIARHLLNVLRNKSVASTPYEI